MVKSKVEHFKIIHKPTHLPHLHPIRKTNKGGSHPLPPSGHYRPPTFLQKRKKK